MRVLEIITESRDTDVSELNEGPILNKIGSGIGKTVGTVAKGVGAVAGGIAGIGKAIKKGYQAGKANVGSGGDDEDIPVTSRTSSKGGSATSGSAASDDSVSTPKPAPKSAPSAGAAPAAKAAPGKTAPATQATGKVDLKTLKGAVATLPKNQRAQLRKIVAAKAGVA